MIVYFTNRYMTVLGKAATNLPNAIQIVEDSEIQEIETGSTILNLTLMYKESQVLEMQTLTDVGNYMLLQDEEQQARMFTIITSENDRKSNEISIYAEEAGLDLLNEVLRPWEPPNSAKPISYYIEKAVWDSGFEIGLNEIGQLTRTLSWDGEATALKRLLSIATQFDHAEISFSFEVENMRVTRKYINVWKKRGDNTQVELRLNKDIDNIITTQSIENLATALDVTGGTPENSDNPITLEGYKFDNGDIYTDRFYLKSRSALSKWTRYLSEVGDKEGHIIVQYNYDTLSQAELCNRAVAQLEKLSQIEVNYEVDIAILPERIKIGDTVNIVDERGELFLEARVLRLERSRVHKSSVATLGDFLIKDSGISQQLQELADKVANIKAGDTYYPWVRYADDDKGNGLSAMPLNKKYMAIKYVVNNPVPSEQPIDYSGLWTLIQGSDGEQGVPGPPGGDGQTKYMWIQYADTVTGSGMSSDPTNKMYMGISFNQSTEMPSKNPKDYTWSAMYDTTKLDELTQKVEGIVYPVVSPDQPNNPKNGMQWWQTDIVNENSVIGYYVYNNGSWDAQTIQQSVLNVVALNAVEITGSKVKGTEIIGSSIQNAFSTVNEGYTLVGTTSLEDSKLLIDFVVKETGQYGGTEVTPQAVSSYTFGANGKLQRSFSLTSNGLSLQSSTGFSGVITAEMAYDTDWVALPVLKGSGSIKVRRYMKRIMLWFDTYVWNGNGTNAPNDAVIALPAEFQTGRMQMLEVPIWSGTPGMSDRYQLNADGRLYKLSNNSKGTSFRTFTEIF